MKKILFLLLILLVSCDKIDDVSKTYDGAKETKKKVDTMEKEFEKIKKIEKELTDLKNRNIALENKNTVLKNQIDEVNRGVEQHEALINTGEKNIKYYTNIIFYIFFILGLMTFLKLFGKPILIIIFVKFLNRIKSKPFSLQDENDHHKNNKLNVDINKSLNIEINNPLFIRKGSILKFDDAKSTTKAPFKAKLHLIIKKLYLWDSVNKGRITISSPFRGCYVSEIIVPQDEIFAFNFFNLLAFESNTKIHSFLKINFSRILENKYFFHYVKGPAKIYLFGFGEIVNENISDVVSFENYTVIGHSGNLKRDISVNHSGIIGIITNKNIFKEAYIGKGEVLRQSIGISPRQVTKMSTNENTWIDYLNAIIGLK